MCNIFERLITLRNDGKIAVKMAKCQRLNEVQMRETA